MRSKPSYQCLILSADLGEASASSFCNSRSCLEGFRVEWSRSAFNSRRQQACQQPPWGYVAGADLTTGRIAWVHKNGTVRDRSPVPLPFEMGVPDLGGPVMTAGGVAFISGTLDYFVRAYDVNHWRPAMEKPATARRSGDANELCERGRPAISFGGRRRPRLARNQGR